jgi:hypothetical protein
MPKLYYYGDKISANMTRTPEGFLICQNVPIARVGSQVYTAGELGLQDADPMQQVTEFRAPEEVFDVAALASFEGKPVTSNHPGEDVDPSNYAMYQKGHVQNVRKGEGALDGYVVADLHITDPTLISEIEHDVKREVSCGYSCMHVMQEDGTSTQTHIRGNHVAVVPQGRAGKTVAIRDSALPESETLPNPIRSQRIMHTPKTLVGRVMDWLTRARDAQGDDLAKLADEMSEAMDVKPVEVPAVTDTPAENPDAQADAQLIEKALAPILAELAAVKAELAELKAGEVGEAPAVDAIGDLLTTLGDKPEGEEIDPIENEESVTVPAEEISEDAAVAPATTDAVTVIKALRKPVADIQDAGDRQRVVDALLTLYTPSKAARTDATNKLVTATQDAARAQAESAPSFDNAKQQEIYDSRNPHMNKGGK